MTSLAPVSPEELARLDHLQVSKRGIADRLLELKEEEVRLIAAARRVSDEWSGLFARIAQERGLDPNAELSINPKTGLVETVRQPMPPQAVQFTPPTAGPQTLEIPTPADPAPEPAPES